MIVFSEIQPGDLVKIFVNEDGVEDGVEDDCDDGCDDGVEDGCDDGIEDGNEDGNEDGVEDGCEDGIKDGFDDGIDDGKWVRILLSTAMEIALYAFTKPLPVSKSYPGSFMSSAVNSRIE